MSKARILLAAATASLALVAAPAGAQTQDGLVNVAIGDVTILEEVDVALAANVVAKICGVSVTAAVLAAVDQGGAPFVCNQRGSGRAVAVTDA